MSEFEFLRYVNVGQYLPTGSWIHHLDARARILATFFLLAAVTLAPNPLALLASLVLAIGLLAAARIPLGFALRNLLPPLPFLLVLAVLQVFLNPSSEPTQALWQWHFLKITTVGLLAGFKLLVRFLALILTLSLSSFCISTSELIHGLESLLKPLQRIGIPTRDFVMMIQVMLRFLPFLAMTAERIAKAQASRGAGLASGRTTLFSRMRQAVPMIIPLFLTGLRRAENLALAMDARGYGNPVHTSMTVMEFRAKDFAAIIGALLIAVGMFLV